jgi:hypothetical protein
MKHQSHQRMLSQTSPWEFVCLLFGKLHPKGISSKEAMLGFTDDVVVMYSSYNLQL